MKAVAVERMSIEQFAALDCSSSKKSKFGNIRTTINGITFDSKKESTRYCQLMMLVKAKEIKNLECQPKYKLCVNGVHVCTYIADFRYQTAKGAVVIEDVKGGNATKTPSYRIKKKLFEALHLGLTIMEI